MSLVQLDKKILWHPFTQHNEWDEREPIVIRSAKGVWLRDSKGRRLLDGVSSLWVNVFGHQVPAIDQAIRRQLSRMAHTTFLGLTHEPAIRLAQELLRIAPKNLKRVFYSDNGSTSVEVALKMAYQYWQLKGQNRTLFVSMKEGYHGDTLGSVSVGGVGLFHERFRHLLFKTTSVTPGDFAEIEEVLRKNRKKAVAVVMEPLMQGASGMLRMPQGYLAHVARCCKKYGIFLIADEVATGFGRTGTMFAVEQEKVEPDFLCLAKSLTGGYLPLAATLATEKIFQAFRGRYDEFKTFFHGHTYTANPLACAAALANLKLYRQKGLLQNVRARARQLAAGLAPLKDHPHVKEVRQIGLMVGIQLVRDKSRGLSYPPAERRGLRVCDEAIKRGLWLRPLGDVVVLMPPLAISKKQTDFLLTALKAAICAST